MKSRGKKRKINNAPTQDFSSALLPGAIGDRASPPSAFSRRQPGLGEAQSPPPLLAGQLLPSILLCTSPSGLNLRESPGLHPRKAEEPIKSWFQQCDSGWVLLSAPSPCFFGV